LLTTKLTKSAFIVHQLANGSSTETVMDAAALMGAFDL